MLVVLQMQVNLPWRPMMSWPKSVRGLGCTRLVTSMCGEALLRSEGIEDDGGRKERALD